MPSALLLLVALCPSHADACGCGGAKAPLEAGSSAAPLPEADAATAADAAAAATSRQQPGDPAVSPCGTAEFTTRTVWIGSDRKEADGRDFEGPARREKVEAFAIDKCEVTVAQFRRFVAATRWKTAAEKFGWSMAFAPHVARSVIEKYAPSEVAAAPWWVALRGAYWRAPHGPGSSALETTAATAGGAVTGPQHPVVHVSWDDAHAFCRWRGDGWRLPTEAEWVAAARGGVERAEFPWGDGVLGDDGTHRMNVWQGEVAPKWNNTLDDGFAGTAPVGSYPANGGGVFDMTGNVWEWVADEWKHPPVQAMGPEGEARLTPPGEGMCAEVTLRTKKGGSFLCHASWCDRYRISGRTGVESDSSMANVGFRCARSLP